jgi:hypothetical protein
VPVRDLGKYERTDAHDDYRHRMMVNLLGLVVTILLIIGGIWIVDKIVEMRKTQDCYLSGRRNCTPIEVPPMQRSGSAAPAIVLAHNVDRDRGKAIPEAERAGARRRQVNDPAPNEGAAVGDRHDHRFSGLAIRDPHLGAERQRTMGGGQRIVV